MSRPIIAGMFRLTYIDGHPEIERDAEYCQVMCRDHSWYARVRDWQCKRRHRTVWQGFRLCQPHARTFARLYEMVEGPEMTMPDMQRRYLEQHEKHRLEREEARHGD